MIRNFILIIIALLSLPSLSLAKGDSDNWIVEGVYGASSVNPSDLNAERTAFIWNFPSGNATQGSFNNLTYFGGSVGHLLFDKVFASLRYEQESQTLGNTPIMGMGASVQDRFVYNPIYLALDLHLLSSSHWQATLGAGVGYALQYQFHNQESGGPGEDVTWQDNPIGFRGRGTLAYMFNGHFGLFAEAFYESISSSNMKAAQAYTTTVNGTAITSGQVLKNVNTGVAAKVDMSGFHYGAGLRLMF